MVNRKHLSQNMAFGLFRLLSLSVVGILFAILGFIIYKGIGVIDWEFLTTAPTNGMTAGGILPAIVGTFCLMAGSALFAFPVGVMSGIYMNEYVPKGWVVRFIRMMTNNLSGRVLSVCSCGAFVARYCDSIRRGIRRNPVYELGRVRNYAFCFYRFCGFKHIRYYGAFCPGFSVRVRACVVCALCACDLYVPVRGVL